MSATTIRVKVIPRSRAASLELLPDGTWVARVKSPPIDGKANQELIALVAEHFRSSKALVSIKSGESGRMKLVRIETR
jgi:uncharacterized protein (TIGR00251 family)